MGCHVSAVSAVFPYLFYFDIAWLFHASDTSIVPDPSTTRYVNPIHFERHKSQAGALLSSYSHPQTLALLHSVHQFILLLLPSRVSAT